MYAVVRENKFLLQVHSSAWHTGVSQHVHPPVGGPAAVHVHHHWCWPGRNGGMFLCDTDAGTV